MSMRRAKWSRIVGVTVWFALLGAGFGGGLRALDGSRLLTTESNRLSYNLPYCDQVGRGEPNCIVRVTLPAVEAPGAEAEWTKTKLAIASDLAL